MEKKPKPLYFACGNCTCKFFNDVSPCGCPRCGETLVSTERIEPPWRVRLFTVREAATALGMSKSKVYEMVERGEIQHHRIGGAIRFSEENLIDLLQETKRERREGEQPTPRVPKLRHVRIR